MIGVAHRAGNSRGALERAIQAGIGWVETDLWWHHGRIVARHERSLWRLPVLYDDWKIGLSLGAPFCLPEILLATHRSTNLLLDLKGAGLKLPRSVVESVRSTHALQRVAICGQDWQALDAAAREEHGLRIFYSFGSEQHLRLMRTRPTDAPAITAASIADRLLTADVIAELLDRQILILAWTVNEPLRARELLEQGVAGIISDRLDLLTDLRDEPSASSDCRLY